VERGRGKDGGTPGLGSSYRRCRVNDPGDRFHDVIAGNDLALLDPPEAPDAIRCGALAIALKRNVIH
jgi:hypothetical protein